ncbi:unnamed protein product [Sphagnum jensenii]|uniref:Uncharacterized protein n=1 Tax=Sphagnum jensenii TaxID=128206 RepID=A0ABP0WX59_9BRYO
MAAQPKTRSILQEAGDPSLHPLQATSGANNPPSIQVIQSVTPPPQPSVGNLSRQEECCLAMHVQTPHCNAHFDLQRTVVYVGAGEFWTKLTHYQEFLFKCQWILICRRACNPCGKLVHNLVKSSCS